MKISRGVRKKGKIVTSRSNEINSCLKFLFYSLFFKDETATGEPPEAPIEDNAPLFYSPGKRGFYSPVQGKGSAERLNAFRNVGRLIGICLLQNELCPLFLNRHVIKFILGRKVRFHDLAFFDPVIYESLRQLVVDAENKVNILILVIQSLEIKDL